MESERREIEQLNAALEHRTAIGKALGMLMERFDMSDDDAFAYLCRCSQAQNRKLYDIAVEMVETRQTPEQEPDAQTA